jgi:hypothetical protein
MSDESKLKQTIKEKAVKDLKVWYEQRSIEIDKQKAKNRLSEAGEPEERLGQGLEASSKYVNVRICSNRTLVAGKEWQI